MKRFVIKSALILLINALLILAALAIFDRSFDYLKVLKVYGETLDKYNILSASQHVRGMLSTHKSHPTFGWTPMPGRNLKNCVFTTDSRGNRSSHEYAPRSDAFVIMIAGDSFTFGTDETDDTKIWPGILESLDPRFQVVNLAVGGYGVDQMYLRIREEITDYKPQLVILAYIDDDLWRSMFSYRFYKKPRFKPEGDKLVLTNTPIGTPEEVVAELRAKYGWLIPGIRLWLEDRSTPEITDRECFPLNRKILHEAADCVKAHSAEFLLVSLAHASELNANETNSLAENFMDGFLAERPVNHLKTRKKFLEAGGQWNSGHYTPREARVVAEAVCARIKELDAWKRYEQQHPETSAPQPSLPNP